MPLRLYNSLSRQVEDFAPIDPPRVSFYRCGLTVYGYAHLGHAKAFVNFDVMIRWLRACGYDVNYVQNITDVGHLTNDSDEGEDPMVREARRRNLHPMAVAETFTRAWLDDMDSLHMIRPDIMPRATGHIPEQIEMAARLIERGHAYVVNGSVYFDVKSFPAYGKLSGRSTDGAEVGTRVSVRGEKRHPADFALWKRAEGGHIMRWNSPWGEGFPGWHLECSAMSMKYLGETIDIHGGGLDNLFPHHECEIAQSECCTGKPFVRYWLHNNMCTFNGQKMSKSLGNGILIREMIRDGHKLLPTTYEPAVVRHFIFTSHYRGTLDFSDDALAAARSGSYKLRDSLREVRTAADGAAEGSRSDAIRAALEAASGRFDAAMNEDFNTAAAIASLFDLTRQTREWVAGGAGKLDLADAAALLTRCAVDVLGFQWQGAAAGASSKTDDLIRLLIDVRKEARAAKQFGLSDQVRDRLTALGIELRDAAGGTTWTVKDG